MSDQGWVTLAFAGVAVAVASLSATLYQQHALTAAAQAAGLAAPSRRRSRRHRDGGAARSASADQEASASAPALATASLPAPPPAGRGKESQHLLNLLYSIAEDQARREGYVHRGVTCNHCNTSPLRGVRYKCANCVDYDLCEACEAAEPHVPRTHVFVKIRVPVPPLANPRTPLAPVLYPGAGRSPNDAALSWDDLRELQRRTHFDHVELEALHDQFRALCDPNAPGGAGISWRVFEQCLGPLGLERNLITERIFSFFDQDGDGLINFSELVCGLSILCKGSQDEKMTYIFKGYDLDGDGFISAGDLEKMFRAYFQLSLELIRDVARALQDDMVQRYNPEGDKPVSAAFSAAIPAEDGRSKSTPPAPPSPAASSGSSGGGSSGASGSDTSSAGGASLRWPTPQQIQPVLEALSDEAIGELVQRTFRAADPDGTGRISFDAFRRVALVDPTVTAWFDALGTVF